MSDPEEFKYDVRVRERMLDAGSLEGAAVKRHLEALPDLEAQSEVMAVQQPALAHAETPSPAATAEAPESASAAAPPPPLVVSPPPPPPPLAVSPPPLAAPPAPAPPTATPAAETESADDDGWGS